MRVTSQKEKVNLGKPFCSPVLIIGSVAYDTISARDVTCERALGGAATYATMSASHFSQAQLVGVVGNDFHSKDLDRLRNHGIDLAGLSINETKKTFFWKGRYNDSLSARETLQTELNAFEDFNPVLPKKYQMTPYVMLGNISPTLQKNVLSQLKASKFIIADTIELWIKLDKAALVDLMQEVDMLVIDQTESALLTGESNFVVAGNLLREMGCDMIIIKHGEHGSTLFHPEGYFRVSAYPTKHVVDPTGAGDTFAGAFLGYLAAIDKTDFQAIKHGMLYATATASITVESFGCEKLEVSGSREITTRYNQLRDWINPN